MAHSRDDLCWDGTDEGRGRRRTGSTLAVSPIVALVAIIWGSSLMAAPASTVALLAEAQAATAQTAAGADEPVPPMVRRVARFLVEYPEVDAFYPEADYQGYPEEVRSQIRLADRENDLCHSSGEDQEAYRACNRRDSAMAALEKQGWCAAGTGKSSRTEWLSCGDDPHYRPDHDPVAPSWSEAEIALLPWEVAELESPCARPNPTGDGTAAAIEGRCAESGLREQQALLNAAFDGLTRALGPAAAARLRDNQRLWEQRRERDVAACAAETHRQSVEAGVAILRCRTGLILPRRRELELVLPIADEMLGGQPDRGPTTGVSGEKSIEEQKLDFRNWELRHWERKAASRIDAAKGTGAKAAAITRFYERPYDWQRMARDTAAIAEAIARRARQVEQGGPK